MPDTPNKPEKDSSVLLYIFIPGVLVAVMLIVLYYGHRHKKSRESSHPHNNFRSDTLITYSGDDVSFLHSPPEPILLKEVKARGRFVVWKGLKTEADFDTAVAVKVFPIVERSSWVTEQEVYKLLRMEHSNVLKFLSVQTNPNLPIEFWLITEFHEKGSLFDFLTNHLVSWEDFCKIAYGMACGLNYLHEELDMGKKPSIAHRDFKSKNVLIKSDLTPCLADFGLALVFEPGKPIGDTYPQVGTRRYMAPEILEGAIIFSRDQFFRIDMYACGLVLWELTSRCTTVWNLLNPSVTPDTRNTADHDCTKYNICGDINTEEYKLPFEVEAGVPNPTLEQMQDLVVNQRIRPRFRERWYCHGGMAKIIRTINECWDQDAEARISASCVIARIQCIQQETNGSPSPSLSLDNVENDA